MIKCFPDTVHICEICMSIVTSVLYSEFVKIDLWKYKGNVTHNKVTGVENKVVYMSEQVDSQV
jgi:hypothetical protein